MTGSEGKPPHLLGLLHIHRLTVFDGGLYGGASLAAAAGTATYLTLDRVVETTAMTPCGTCLHC